MRTTPPGGSPSLFECAGPPDEETGWPVMHYYRWIVKNLGVPAKFYWSPTKGEWVAEAPFTKLDDAALARVLGDGDE